MSVQLPAGPWRYRPNKYDDWGFVRDASGELVAVARRPSSEEELAAHRRAGTDPCEGVGRALAALPDVLAALKQLRIDANRLCDRMLGGTYEEDCRRAIAVADAAIKKVMGL